MSAGRRVTACNLCSAAPHGGWFQTVPRPDRAGRENSHGDTLTDTTDSTGGRAGSKVITPLGSPSGGQHPWQRAGDLGGRHVGLRVLWHGTPYPRMNQTISPPGTELTTGLRGQQPASTGQTIEYLVLRLLQVPTCPEGEAEAMADFGLIFSASQLLRQPQS